MTLDGRIHVLGGSASGGSSRLMEDRLAEDRPEALREARWTGEHVVNGEALLPLEDEEE